MLIYEGTEKAPGTSHWDTGLFLAPFHDASGALVPGKVDGDRPYGKDPGYDATKVDYTRIDFVQQRAAYCAIWRWAASKPGYYGNKPSGYYATLPNEC